MTIAVLALQGAFIEHEQMLQKLGVHTIELRQDVYKRQDQINAQISALQTQNQSNQELINSLQTGNNGIKDAIDTTTATQEQLTSLAKESINNLHTFRSTFDQNILCLLYTSSPLQNLHQSSLLHP